MVRLLSYLLLIFLYSPIAVGLENQLRDNVSPYLSLHSNDPVHWQDWNQSVLDKARKENKLIFISSGYFACHWCHVMQRESYNDSAIAKWLNQHFIPVKIDRELEPALDAHLIEFLRRTRGNAGWPLNVFLTPEGYPLVGLTYAPPERFKTLLESLQNVWKTKSDELAATAKLATEELLAESSRSSEKQEINKSRLAEDLIVMTLALGDDLQGGIGQQNRFPMSPLWSALIDIEKSHTDQRLRNLITLTLDQMAEKGLRDHLAGGFFRYTIDPDWRTPHYEKMLYNQALQSRLYLKAGKLYGREDYLAVAEDTLNFTLDAFAGEKGGYIASLSAIDPNDVEGGGYLWSQRQLEELLTNDEFVFAQKRWSLQGDNKVDGGYLPNVGHSLDELSSSMSLSLERLSLLEGSVKRKLLLDAQLRAHPRDTKQLAGWNGLLLTALVEAADVSRNDKFKNTAKQLKHYLVTELWDGERLFRAKTEKGAIGQAGLEDYVFVAEGLWRWSVLAEDKDTELLAKQLVEQSWRRFYVESGWLYSDSSLIPGLKPEYAIPDNPLPSPIPTLVKLTALLGESELKEQSVAALRNGYGVLNKSPMPYASHVLELIDSEFPLN